MCLLVLRQLQPENLHIQPRVAFGGSKLIVLLGVGDRFFGTKIVESCGVYLFQPTDAGLHQQT